jgi:ankyrin repeat protein
LHAAVRHGHAEAVSLLLQNGADTNAGDFCANTALDLAARCGNPTVLKMLRAHGAFDSS